MVLLVFVIALLNPLRDEGPGGDPRQTAIAVLIGAGMVAAAAVAFLGGGLGKEFSAGDSIAGGAQLGSIQAMGTALYRDFALPVEATALVLVVAAVGAGYLSRGKRWPGHADAAPQPLPASVC